MIAGISRLFTKDTVDRTEPTRFVWFVANNDGTPRGDESGLLFFYAGDEVAAEKEYRKRMMDPNILFVAITDDKTKVIAHYYNGDQK